MASATTYLPSCPKVLVLVGSFVLFVVFCVCPVCVCSLVTAITETNADNNEPMTNNRMGKDVINRAQNRLIKLYNPAFYKPPLTKVSTSALVVPT